MCYSLPSPEDPFNERHGKEDFSSRKIKRLAPEVKTKQTLKKEANKQQKRMLSGDQVNIKEKNTKLGGGDFQDFTSGNSGCPSKFLCSCLNSIKDSLLGDGVLNKEQDKPLFVDSWGVEFWKSYSSGVDILENSGSSPSVQQMAWIASTAADSISQKEKDGISFTSPFLLYLVPSQQKANKVSWHNFLSFF